MWAISLSKMPYIKLKKFPQVSTLLRAFSMNGLELREMLLLHLRRWSCGFCSLCDMAYYINRLSNVQPALNSWGKYPLVWSMIFFIFILLDSLCYFFVGGFLCTFMMDRWPVVLLWNFVWLYHQSFIEWVGECSLLLCVLEDFVKNWYYLYIYIYRTHQCSHLGLGIVLFYFINSSFSLMELSTQIFSVEGILWTTKWRGKGVSYKYCGKIPASHEQAVWLRVLNRGVTWPDFHGRRATWVLAWEHTRRGQGR